jgi:hypothetical protein
MLLRWTERVLERQASGGFTERDRIDARNSRACLVWEAGRHLGDNSSSVYLATLERLASVGVAVEQNDFKAAESLCLDVEDALLRLKREERRRP